MTPSEDKERWKKEAQQLKEDLQSRQKIIQKREVPIKFPNPNQSQKEPLNPPKNTSKNTAHTDNHFRQQLGL